MAEGIMKDMVQQHRLDWYVDSAGTESYHIGERPDRRAIRTCNKYGIDISGQRARKLVKEDFETFDLVYALADEVVYEISRAHTQLPAGVAPILLLDEAYPGEHRSVPDPWYGKEEGFEPVFHLIKKGCEAIVKNHGNKVVQGNSEA